MTSFLPVRAVAVLALAVTAGCGSASNVADKAGGHAGPITLRMASTPSGPADNPVVDYFVKRVAAVSQGRVTISLINQWGGYAPDAEQQVVHAVASGKVDLGWAGSGGFDVLGVTAFEPLSAPMLIDSYPLLQAVLTSALPGRMLSALDRLGITGLGVAADSLRLPVSVKTPLISPAAWRANHFGSYRSNVQDATVRALGGDPVHAFGPFRKQGLDSGAITAFEFDVRRYQELGLVAKAPYVVSNEVLWPLVDVFFANPAQMSRLSEKQRGWLRQAMTDTTGHAIDIARQTAPAVRVVCAMGARFATATKAQLASLRAAVDGVYTTIEQNPQSKAAIDQIDQLKASAGAGPVLGVPTSCAR
jgi:TRAP-type C4-dicarboxylate transport system substrate-binding protein